MTGIPLRKLGTTGYEISTIEARCHPEPTRFPGRREVAVRVHGWL
jgi:hypothetical protein